MSRITELLGGESEPLMVSVSSEERIVSAGPKGQKMLKGYCNPSNKGISEVSDYVHVDTSEREARKKLEQLDIGNHPVSLDTDSLNLGIRANSSVIQYFSQNRISSNNGNTF